ncbi:hypothetical protein SDC9_102019 [bioreactor metagenome]|uniref:Biotin transporter BioY n=1 Tax=bioreactor metagenome TaxID=1076179 RepID=A0A645AQP4_9ZZZZ
MIELKNKTCQIVICGLLASMIAISAFIQIPIPNLDYFTLQFLFVLLAGMLLGPKLGGVSVIVYVITGLMGFPIFAAGGGITYILRPSFGYLIGFILCAFVTGLVCEKIKSKKISKYLIAAFCGFLVTYTIGLTYKYLILNFYMGTKIPFVAILLSCFPLDIPGDIVLCITASFVGAKLIKYVKKENVNYA